MYLKSLEVVGFKSFAPLTVINFHRGVTAIVGPNGCGKSNVLDSIRWVLGETSARALRGAHMQDVIFSGTDSRKAMGMAEVALTFAECERELGTEFSEVRVCRRVFRDGRGEYEINKTPCRLKDIHKLFMDTGIGRSAYSIMEQGKLDQILSSKPEDRRAIFEEAAGITRFKSQKKEALRKLEQTEANLLRVSDIVKEVNRQIGSLQRQAGKARRYQEVFARLRDLDTRLARHEYGTLRARLDECEAAEREARGRFAELQGTVETREESVRQRRAEVERLEREVRALEQERGRADSRALHARQQVTFNTLNIEQLEALTARNRTEIAASEERLGAERGQYDSVSAEAARLAAELQRERGELAAHRQRLDAGKRAVADNLAQRSRFEAEVGALDTGINEAKNRLAGIELQRKNYSVRFAKLAEDEGLFQSQRGELEEKCAALAGQNAALAREIAALTVTVADGEQSLSAAEAALAAARERAERARRALAENGNGRRALETMLEVHAGYSAGTRKILASYRGKGVVGTLLDRLQVRAGYEQAVEAALGAACEAVMVENGAALEQIVAELGESGALAFTDLSVANREDSKAAEADARPRSFWHKLSALFAAKEAPPAAAAAAAAADLALPVVAEFVECDAAVRKLATRILDGFLFVEDADEALTVTRARADKHVVTRMGEVWYREGWQLRGRARDGKQSVLQYESQLAALRGQTAGLEAARAAADDAAARAAAAAETRRGELAAGQQRQRELAAQLSAARYEEQGFARQREDAGNRLQAVARERESLNAQTGTDGDELQRLTGTLREFAAARAGKIEAREALEAAFGELNSDVERRTQALTESLVREAKAVQQLDAARQRNEALTARFRELEQAVERLRGEIGGYEEKVARSREGIVSAEAAITQAEEEARGRGVRIGELEELKRGVAEETGGLEEALRVDRRLATELQAQSGRAEVQAAEQRMRLEALVERVRRQYEVDLEGWGTEGTQGIEETQVSPASPETDWLQISAEVEELREKLDRMGPVNIEAITEYEELEQRQTFLNQQEQDLTQARDQLHEAIKKINQTTQVLFAETFAKVQANFSEMFLEIFGGGKAELQLQDAADPLECGIDIIARPPGKQLTSISLLSGGERTMTAVALMFAIYMVKPSPFCFLDEMDAPLDESNINRFIRLVQRFVQQSQFVVITHNKRTISSADVLYGVTMEEHGVSKLVSVKMARQDEDPLFNGNAPAPKSIADAIRGESVLPPAETII